MNKDLLSEAIGFEWDLANIDKNWIRHKVSALECEQIYFNQPLVIADDPKHSQHEIRFYALGKTYTDRLLFVVFTIRNKHIRIISARDMSKKERRIYKHHEKK